MFRVVLYGVGGIVALYGLAALAVLVIGHFWGNRMPVDLPPE